jgi:HAD superfamily hydrolase (TIGR01484 family)
MSPHKLILLDIDGTLLDSKYHSDDPKLIDLIAELQHSGVAFGLNSNRALEDLLPVAKMFGIEGPIVGENGVFVYYPAKGKTKYFLDEAQLVALKQTKQQSELKMRQLLQQAFSASEVRWEEADTIKAAAGANKSKYQENAIVVLNNRFRKYTVSAHLKTYRRGTLEPLKDILPELTAALSNAFKSKDITVAYSSLFANILVYSSLVSKRRAVEHLLKEDFPSAELFVIGDELGDYEMAAGLGEFLCVANASDEAKAKASRISPQPHSQGVRWLLQSISTNS